MNHFLKFIFKKYIYGINIYLKENKKHFNILIYLLPFSLFQILCILNYNLVKMSYKILKIILRACSNQSPLALRATARGGCEAAASRSTHKLGEALPRYITLLYYHVLHNLQSRQHVQRPRQELRVKGCA